MDILHPAYRIKEASTPLITAAIHAGHNVRASLVPYFAIDEEMRLREEDPATDFLAGISDASVIGRQSRFVVDLNRTRDAAVYLKPEDAWGLQVWKKELPEAEIAESLKYFDDFYSDLRFFLDRVVARYGSFVVYDIHSYNHRRNGPEQDPADAGENPEVNIGTGNMNRALWAPLVNNFIRQLRTFSLDGRPLDVRENVKFQGGAFSRWIHSNYPDCSCVLAIEFKKIFMDEWTGEINHHAIAQLKHALAATTSGTLQELNRIKERISVH